MPTITPSSPGWSPSEQASSRTEPSPIAGGREDARAGELQDPPQDRFKGYTSFVVQDLLIRPHVVDVRRAPGDIEEHKKDIVLLPGDCAIWCMLTLVKDLGNRLVRRDVTMDDLWDVFSSGHGAGIVGEIMFAPIAEALRRALDALPDQ